MHRELAGLLNYCRVERRLAPLTCSAYERDVGTYIAALKFFFRFLLEDEQIDRDPAQVLRTPKKRETLPDVLDGRELVRRRGRSS
jgi:site-specific recombinase XerC